MKRAVFITIFLSIHIAFVFLYLHKQERMIALNYTIQKNEQQLEALIKKEEDLHLELERRREPAGVKIFAGKKLKMHPMKLSDVRKFPDDS